MRKPLTIKDCHIAGASDLTVVAPIRRGFVPGLDAVTYKSRVIRVLRTLHAGRAASHESDLARLLSDAVERVGRIHSVRMAVLEPEDAVREPRSGVLEPEGAVLLAVTFDGAWESYVRVIWQKVARLLDLVFCNTEDYVVGWTSSFDEWGRWLRSRQQQTSFLYATPEFTVDDVKYLRMQEGLQRSGADADPALCRTRVPAAEEIAYQWFENGTDPTHQGRTGTPLTGVVEPRPALFRQGLRSLVGLYRLTDVYARAPGSPDRDDLLLLRAARELLPDFFRLVQGDSKLDTALERAAGRFSEQLGWLLQADELPASRQWPALPDGPVHDGPDAIQGGILEPYAYADHGVLLLLSCRTPAAMERLLAAAAPTTARKQGQLKAGDLTCNVALTVEGLRMCGLDDDDLARLPQEFVQGMERRAGLLGDLRQNHPRRWRLPPMNWSDGPHAREVSEADPVPRVAMTAVHVLVQLRLVVPAPGQAGPTPEQARATLFDALQPIAGADAGVTPLSLQWMARMRSSSSAPPGKIVEHFGFQDGDSDPVLTSAAAGRFYANHVHAGEALIGHANASDAALPEPAAGDFVGRLLRNGSFLVVRKLRQDIEVLEASVRRAIDENPAVGLKREDVLARMMGRWPDGHAAAGTPLGGLPAQRLNDNDFNYHNDPEGKGCPIHAHIRRANPRPVVRAELQAQMVDGARPPRLFRRSMSYGPRHDRAVADAGHRAASLAAERGLVFMAYGSSIGEQFEVVQRWLTGGNSAGGYSGQADPFVGLPQPGVEQYYRFEQDGKAVCIAVGGDRDMLAEPRPMVRLEWGGYFLTPSLPALGLLRERARQAAAVPALPWSVAQGRATIERLRALEAREGAGPAREAWKAALEDTEAAANLVTASVWAAIRADFGGVLRTPYGVLVADRKHVAEILADPQGRLTSTGYLPRMRASFGPIYLGMDAGQEEGRYELESLACNRAILDLDARQAMQRASTAVANRLDLWVAEAITHAHVDEALRRRVDRPPRDLVRWELTLEVRELIDELLAVFCESWFGLSDAGQLFQRSGFRWTWKDDEPPCYPGHFMAPSRYIFQPHPAPTVEQVGASHGQAMRRAVEAHLRAHGATIQAPVTRAVLDAVPGVRDPALAARTIVGALMGMVPTIDANLRRVLATWLDEGVLWSLRASRPHLPAAALLDQVKAAFVHAMQSRPAPDTLWRTAKRSFQLGGVAIEPGDLVVAGLSSSANDSLAASVQDVSAAFGGDRTQAGHPTHACPGYPAAMAMMLGFVAALVESPLPLKPGPGPLTIALDGQVPFRDPIPEDAAVPAALPKRLAALRAVPSPESAEPAGLAALRRCGLATVRYVAPGRAAPTPIWTFGDSWLAKLPFFPELIGSLPAVGYEATLWAAEPGRTLATMEALAVDVAQSLAAAGGARPPLKALLVGGGGNDIVEPWKQPTKTWLYRLLVPGAAMPEQALDPIQLDHFVDGQLGRRFEAILDRLVPVADGVPILVHGYDFPVPDGRAATVVGIGSGPWLQRVFEAHAMTRLDFNRAVMKVLIQRLNRMLATVTALPRFAGRVHHLDLTGTLDTDPGVDGAHRALWDNELHPSAAGYDRLAGRIAHMLRDLGVGVP